jgi:hypothetical protein
MVRYLLSVNALAFINGAILLSAGSAVEKAGCEYAFIHLLLFMSNDIYVWW